MKLNAGVHSIVKCEICSVRYERRDKSIALYAYSHPLPSDALYTVKIYVNKKKWEAIQPIAKVKLTVFGSFGETGRHSVDITPKLHDDRVTLYAFFTRDFFYLILGKIFLFYICRFPVTVTHTLKCVY